MKTLPLFVGILISFHYSFSQTHGVALGWGTEVPLPKFDSSKSQRGILYNNMVQAGSGRIFILTVESNPLNQMMTGVYISYSDDNGVNWSPALPFTPINLVVGGSPPKITVDSGNNLNLIWSSKIPSALFFSKLDFNLNVLIDTVRVASMINYNSFTPHITCDMNGRLHAVWHEGDHDAGETGEVYYTKSFTGGSFWAVPTMISNNDSMHSLFPRVQLDAASGDTIAIAWRDSASPPNNWDIHMALSIDGGDTWDPAFNVLSGPNFDSDPDVVIDPESRIHLFTHQYPQGNFFNGANVRYAYSDDLGVSWSDTGLIRISDSGFRSHLVEGSRYDLVNNILWTFWKDERDFFNGQERGDMVAIFSLNRGLSWSPPEFVSDWDSLPVGYKAACVLQNGEVGVNYEVGNQTTGLGIRQVYFRKRVAPFTNLGNEYTSKWGLLIFPNPASSQINIVSDKPMNQTSVTLVDCFGHLMKEINNNNGRKITIQTEGYSAGLYCIRVQRNHELIEVHKIVITD